MNEVNQLRKLMEAIGHNRPTHFRVDKEIADDMYRYEPGTWWPLAADLFAPQDATPQNFQAWLDEMGRDDVRAEFATFDDPEATYPVEESKEGSDEELSSSLPYDEKPTEDDWDEFLARKFGSKDKEEVTEDWGSSDWYTVLKSMDEYIDKHGLSPQSIKDAAYDAAISWGQYMGYDMRYRDGEEAAQDRIIWMWMHNSERGKKLQQLVAPKESIGEDDLPSTPEKASGYRLEADSIGDRETVKIMYNSKVLIEMDRPAFERLIFDYRKIQKGY